MTAAREIINATDSLIQNMTEIVISVEYITAMISNSNIPVYNTDLRASIIHNWTVLISTRLTSKTKSVTLHFFFSILELVTHYTTEIVSKKIYRLETFSEHVLQVKTLINLFSAWRRPRRYRRRCLSTNFH